MSSQHEVTSFLNDFKAKLSIWGVVYRDGIPKNTQTLLALDIIPSQRTEALKSLQVKDYSEGRYPKSCMQEVTCGCLAKWLRAKRCI